MRTHTHRIAGVLALGLGLLLGAGQVSAAHQAKTPVWITSKGKIVNLTVVAAYNNAASGFSFNGYNKGKMTITVPLGATVHVTFSNASTLPHSLEFTAYTKTLPTGAVTAAFKGASSPNAANGVDKGVTQKFSFTASKAGKFMMICAVPGHYAAGMWDNFVVSKSAKSGTIAIAK